MVSAAGPRRAIGGSAEAVAPGRPTRAFPVKVAPGVWAQSPKGSRQLAGAPDHQASVRAVWHNLQPAQHRTALRPRRWKLESDS